MPTFSLVFNMMGKWYGSPLKTKPTTRLLTTSQYKQGESLPYKVKLGSEDAPVYKEFNSLQDFKAFYFDIQKHIQETISEGWKKKDSIDWSQYQA